MTTSAIFKTRRKQLLEKLGEASALFHNGPLRYGNLSSASLPFRSNSHCLYFAGALPPGALLFISGSETVLGLPPRTAEDAVWEGAGEAEEVVKARTGCDRVLLVDELRSRIREHAPTVLAVPTLHPDVNAELTGVLGREPSLTGLDARLARAIVACRLTHDREALADIASACTVTSAMFDAASRVARPGAKEYEVRAALYAVALRNGHEMAFTPTVTVHGEVLHNSECRNELRPGALLLVDAGAESPSGWAADATRTWPIGGKFTAEQRACYELVLAAQADALRMIRPGVEWRDVHFAAARTITSGLRDLGILRGELSSLVERNAHTLFFYHGLGHLIGLDVHDMEDLGDIAGYEDGRSRDPQFGTKFLRLDRPLKENMVVSVEPGIYFSQPLLRNEALTGALRDAVDFTVLERFMPVRGIRIEDTVWVNGDGANLLTGAIPKDPARIEDALSAHAE